MHATELANAEFPIGSSGQYLQLLKGWGDQLNGMIFDAYRGAESLKFGRGAFCQDSPSTSGREILGPVYAMPWAEKAMVIIIIIFCKPASKNIMGRLLSPFILMCI